MIEASYPDRASHCHTGTPVASSSAKPPPSDRVGIIGLADLVTALVD